MKSILALGLVVVTATGAAACSSDQGSKAADEKGSSVTATTEPKKAPSVCALTSIDEVRARFGGAVEATVDDGRCRFEVGGGVVRFQLWDGPESIADLAPGGVPVDDLGDDALWKPALDSDGGVLAVQVKDRVLLFETLVAGTDPDVAKARLVGWAQLIAARYASDGVVTTTAAPGGSEAADPLDPCQMISQAQLEQLLGRPGRRTRQGNLCTINLGKGSTLTLGPKTGPVTEGTLDGLARTSKVNGKEVPWKRTELDLGQGAVLLTNPTNEGTVDLYVAVNGDLVHIGVNGTDTKRSKYVATAAARQVIAHG